MTLPEIGGKVSLIFKEREIDILLKFMIDKGYCVKNGSHFALPKHQPHIAKNLEESFLLCLVCETIEGKLTATPWINLLM